MQFIYRYCRAPTAKVIEDQFGLPPGSVTLVTRDGLLEVFVPNELNAAQHIQLDEMMRVYRPLDWSPWP